MPRSAMRALLVVVAGLALGVTLRPSPVFAQGGVLGSITGNVFDQAGMPMRGVKIVAKSPTHIGERVTYSADDGGFRIVALQPGNFEIVASAPKMNAIHQKGIKVGVNAPAEVNVVMEVATKTEEVKIIEKAPIVSTKSAQVKEVWDEEFIDNLPLETRTSVEEMVTAAPGGSGDAGGRIARVRGGNQNQNLYLVDGFNLTGLKTVYKSLAAMEVSTGGYGADGAIAPGGLITMVTKTGSNRYELDINGFHEDSRLRLFQEEADRVPNDMRSYINPNLSGPIIKDKLWFYVNGEARNEIYSSGPDPSGFFVDYNMPDQHYWNYRATGKLTYQINPRNKLQSFTFYDKNWSRNRNRAYNAEEDAQQKRERYGFFSGVTWESLLTDTLFFKAQAGFSHTQEKYQPQQCLTNPNCLDIPPVLQFHPASGMNVNLKNNNADRMLDMKAIELVGTLEGFFNSPSLGDHDVKLTSRFYSRREMEKISAPGGRQDEFIGNDLAATTYYYSNDPRIDGQERYGYAMLGSNGQRLTFTLQDTAKVTRYVTLTPGVAMTTASSTNSRSGENITEGVAFTPHFAAAWDATHDGRTVVRASYNHYVDPDVGRISRHTLGGRVQKRCQYINGVETNCVFSGGSSSATVGSRCGPSGYDENGNSCRTKLSTPRTYEYTFGAERELIEGLGVGIDFVYRDYKNQYSTSETNRIWNASGSEVQRTGGYRNGKPTTVIDLSTPADALRTYRGVTFAAHKRDGALKVSASYTWARQEGNIWDTEVNLWGDIPPRDIYLWGPTPDDVRHNIRTTLVYRFNPWLSAGVLYNYNSGQPYSRFFRNVETGGWDDLRSRVGSTPGNDRNDPDDDRETRLPDIQKLDLQLRANLKPLTGQDAEIYADMLNALGLRTATSYFQNDGPSYGTVAERMRVTVLRLGFRFRY